MEFSKNTLIEEESTLEILQIIEQLQNRVTYISDLIQMDQPFDSLVVVCKRDLHNLKGTLGMLGFKKQMSFIHEVEDYFCKEHVDKNELQNFFPSFTMALDYLGQSIELNASFEYDFNSLISNPKNVFKQKINHTSQSEITSILKKENKKLQAYKSKLKKSIVTLGRDSNNYVPNSDTFMNTFNNSFEVYKSFLELGNVELVIIDTDTISENPFLFQNALNRFSPQTKFLYIVSDYEEFADFLEEHNEFLFNFYVTSKKKARENIAKFLSKCPIEVSA